MEQTLKFYGGRLGSAVPLLFFVFWAISISVAGAPSEHGLILGMVIGITLGMLLCRSLWGEYANAVFAGMANPVATVTIVAAESVAAHWVYRISAVLLAALAVLTQLTGAKTSVIWFRICPMLLGTCAALLVIASFA